MKNPESTPPSFFLHFFRWFCHPSLAKYVEGDLMELYEERVREKGKRNADINFSIDVLLLFRPGIIKPAGYQQLNTYGMYKSYIKVGWRNLVRNKSYSIINVAGLTLSMACGIFIFSLVSQHLSYDNFHHNPDQTYRIVTEMHRDNIGYTNCVPSPLGEYFRNDYTYAEKVARVYMEPGALVTLKRENTLTKFKETDGIAFAETSFFDIFNFPLLYGDAASALTEPNAAIVTERIARKYFGDQDAIGETFWLENKIPFTVKGVLKNLPSNTDIKSEIFVSYVTLKAHSPWLADETGGWGGIRSGMYCYVRLQADASAAKVEEVLSAYVKIHRAESKNVHHYKLQPLNDIHFNAQYGGPMGKNKLWILTILGVFLIATACLNFVNLATAQALRRSKEVGVRKVLGSFRFQLFWQFIFETGIITFMSILAACIIAYVTFPMINTFFNTAIDVNSIVDKWLLLFVLVLGIVVTLLAGYYPGLVLSGFRPVAALKGRLSQQNVGGFNTRRTLIVVQFAISQVLIIGMIVIMHQMKFATQSHLGFDKDAIVMVTMGRDSTGTRASVLKNEITGIPGVEKISLCFAAPSSEYEWGNSIRFDNSVEEVNFRTSMKLADADYLSTFDLELVAGRNLSPSDTVKEILVNETLIHKLNLQSPEEALGRMISANNGSMNGAIVGVVKDFHDKSFHEEISPILITTYTRDYMNYAVKLNMAHAKGVLSDIESLWQQQHPDQIFEYEFLDESIAHFYEAEETMLRLIQTFSFIAIFIGALGLYGLVSFMVSQKVKEIGIRKVLGGTGHHIVWIFGKEFVRLIVIAFLIAAPLGWWLMSNWLKDFEFQTQISSWPFVWAMGCSLVVAAVTVSYQVLTTALMNPVNSLRSE